MSRPTYRLELQTIVVCCDRDASGPLGSRVDGAAVAASVFRAWMIEQRLDPRQEHFMVLALDARARASGIRTVSTGTLTCSIVHPREVFRAAIEMSAAQIIVAHNHPSGDVRPSDEDVTLTERLTHAGLLLGIPLVDSIVLGFGTDYGSVGVV